MNGNQGLGQLSEGPLEAQHKLIRKFRTRLARLTNESDNLHDVYNRLYMQSCPITRKFNPTKKIRKSQESEKTADDEIIDMYLY